MKQAINIPTLGNITHGDDFCTTLCSVLIDEKYQYQNKLIPDLSYIHNLAQCTSGIKIVNVEHQVINQYRLNYDVEWFIYNGCIGMDEQGTINEYTTVVVEDNSTINIDCSISEQRSSADEL
jgi:hypothetical protein